MSPRIGLLTGLLVGVALAGCISPDSPSADEGPPHVLTVRTDYVAEVEGTYSGQKPARLPNTTVAQPPMMIQVTVDNAFAPAEGRYPDDARAGWEYDTACPRVDQHASDRERDNRCDGHPVRSRFVLPPLYPHDRAFNYSHRYTPETDGYIGYSTDWFGRGYRFDTENGSRYWNYTQSFQGTLPIGEDGTVELVFHHKTPLEIRLTSAHGEIPEAWDDDVISPDNCTSDEGETDYVKGSLPQVLEVQGEVEPFEKSSAGRYKADKGDRYSTFKAWLEGDATVTMGWSALCFREDEGGVA